MWVSGGLGGLKNTEKTQRCILVRAIGALHLAVEVICIREYPNQGVTTRVCKRFGKGSLGAILWHVGGEVASMAVEKKGEGEELSVLLSGLPCSRCKTRSCPKDSVVSVCHLLFFVLSPL